MQPRVLNLARHAASTILATVATLAVRMWRRCWRRWRLWRWGCEDDTGDGGDSGGEDVNEDDAAALAPLCWLINDGQQEIVRNSLSPNWLSFKHGQKPWFTINPVFPIKRGRVGGRLICPWKWFRVVRLSWGDGGGRSSLILFWEQSRQRNDTMNGNGQEINIASQNILLLPQNIQDKTRQTILITQGMSCHASTLFRRNWG